MVLNTIKNTFLPILLLLFFSACSGSGGKPILEDDGDGNSGGSETDSIAPTPPVNLQVEGEVKSNSVSIVWGASTDDTGVAGYRVYRGSTQLAEITQTRYTDNNVTGSQTYQYEVVAFDAAQNTASSTLMVSTPAEEPVGDTEAPSAPTNLRLLGVVTTNAVSFEWDISTDNIGVSGYQVFRDDVMVAQNSAEETSYTDSDVSSGNSYQYRVEAFDEAQNISSSESLTVTTPSDPPPPPPDTTPPSQPANLRLLGSVDLTSLSIEWDASSDNVGVVGYRVFRDAELLAEIGTTNYTDNSVTASQTYVYQVKAYDQAGNTAASLPLSVTTPDDTEAPSAPTNLRVVGTPGSTSLTFAWDASTDNLAVAGYRIFRIETGVIDVVTETSYTDVTVEPSQTYRYEVIAFDDALNSTVSANTLSVTTTSSNTDTIDPTIVSVSPDNASTAIPIDLAIITADFSEAIDANTINVTNFTLDNGLSGTLSTANGNTKAIFSPSSPLDSSTTYTATLSGVTDVAGNPLVGNDQQVYSWSFTTCGDNLTSTYTILWDAVVDPDLSGYRVYYSLSKPLTNTNATSIDLAADTTAWQMNPSSLGFQPCDTVYIAITALSEVRSESALSNIVSETVE